MQRARQASCCIWMSLADWIERCLVVKEDSITPTFKKQYHDGPGKMAVTCSHILPNDGITSRIWEKKGFMHGGPPEIGWIPSRALDNSFHKPSLHTHSTDTKTIFLVIKHTSANTGSH